MKGTRIVGDERAAVREHTHQHQKICVSDEVDAIDVICGIPVFDSSDDHARRTVLLPQLCRQLRKPLRGPSFGVAKRRAGSDGYQRLTRPPATIDQQRRGQLARTRRHVDLRRQRTSLDAKLSDKVRIVLADVHLASGTAHRPCQQQPSPVRAIPPSLFHTSALQRQRRAERIRKQQSNRRLEAGDVLRRLEHGNAIDTGHGAKQFRHRRPCGHRERLARKVPANVPQGR